MELSKHLELEMKQIRIDQDGLINNMIEPKLLSFDEEMGTVEFSFRVMPWAVNKSGTAHGGVLAVCCDCIMAMFARYYANGSFAPTVSLDMKYIKAMRAGDSFRIKAYKVNAGRRIISIRCEIINREDKVVATAAGVFMNIEEE